MKKQQSAKKFSIMLVGDYYDNSMKNKSTGSQLNVTTKELF